VQADWDSAYGKHLVALRDVWDHQKSAIARALPLTVDDEPVDLLELLDQQPAAPTSPASTPEVVPVFVELEVAIPHLSPA